MVFFRGILLFTVLVTVNCRDVTIPELSFINVYNDIHGNNKPPLVMDQSWFTVNNSAAFDLLLYAQSHECYKCEMMYLRTIPAGTTTTLVGNATFPTEIQLLSRPGPDNSTQRCRFSVMFRENGDYWLFFNQSQDETSSCDYSIANDPMAAEMPILYVFLGLLGLWIIIKSFSYCYTTKFTRKRKQSRTDGQHNASQTATELQVESAEEPVTTHSKKERLKSLDTLRGISLMIMIFVNFGGGGYWFFDHPPWNGLTVADLVFPWFVFMMGASMNYSFRSMFKRGKSRIWILRKVIRRAVLLFAFGIILNTGWGPVDLDTMRIPGVLQRLSLSYLAVALLETVFARRDTAVGKDKRWSAFADVVLFIPEWIISLGIMGAYLALTFALPVPGCPTGYIGPGGLHDGKRYENCTGGAAGYIDRVVLGEKHIYGNPTPKKIYQTVVAYDPEGILGTLSAVFLCFLGLQAGRIFIFYKTHSGRIGRLVIWSLITGAIGAGLCECSQNDGIIPLNKNLWSASFTLITACFGYIFLSGLYIVIDVLKLWNGTPFIYPGMNSLVVYICHDVFYRFFPVNWQMDPVHWKLLLRAVWDVAIWVVLAFWMYCRKLFIAL